MPAKGSDVVVTESLDETYRFAMLHPWTVPAPPEPQPKFRSPLESGFWAEHRRQHLPQLVGLVPNHRVMADGHRYELDFALPDRKIAFELDGYTYHSSRNAWSHDRRRDLRLSLAGWHIHRLPSDLIENQMDEAVRLAARLAA